MKRINPIYTSLARSLRTNQTDVEKILWYHLRNRQVENVKFRRQHTIGKYIVDFVSVDERLIIELDGGQHNDELVKKQDNERIKYLEEQGFTILRFWNNEVLENLEEVLEVIRSKVSSYPHLTLSLKRRGNKKDTNNYETGKNYHT